MRRGKPRRGLWENKGRWTLAIDKYYLVDAIDIELDQVITGENLAELSIAGT